MKTRLLSWFLGYCVLTFIGTLGLGLLNQENLVTQSAQGAEQGDKEIAEWMQMKLRSSQEILAGLTKGDFKSIEEQTGRLMVFNLLEKYISHDSLKDVDAYREQLKIFETATKELRKQAAAKDIDATLKSYQQLTASCVHCHKLLRD